MNIKRNKPTRFHNDKIHRSFGIQNWLCKKGFILSNKNAINGELYKGLLKDFCLFIKPDFDFSLVTGMETYESFCQSHWIEFCNFCINKFKN
jgi:hypothetical protein